MSRFEAIPVQFCPLALSLSGLGGLLTHWSRLQGLNLAPLPLTCAMSSVVLLCMYMSKILVKPAVLWNDISSAQTLSAVTAVPATIQVLAVRFAEILSLEVTQNMILASFMLNTVLAARYALLVYRSGLRPEPTWFPGLFMWMFVCSTSHAAGPEWLREMAPYHFFAGVAGYFILFPIVVYRILCSTARDSVAPNAGMSVLMSPSSVWAVTQMSSGKPGGDTLGLFFFAMSTFFFLVTLRLLFVRRSLWIAAFHPSYVAFTFPFTATATAAVLATERLPAVSRFTCVWWWATCLTLVSTLLNLRILVRFLVLVLESSSAQPVKAKKVD